MARYRLGSALLLTAFLFLCPIHALVLPFNRRAPEAPGLRLIQYIQTFTEANDPTKQLSLLPLTKKSCPVSHVILAALHVNPTPGDITLNDHSPSASLYDNVWSDVKLLQQRGIKVLVMMGGAARGSYAGRLCRTGSGELVSVREH